MSQIVGIDSDEGRDGRFTSFRLIGRRGGQLVN